MEPLQQSLGDQQGEEEEASTPLGFRAAGARAAGEGGGAGQGRRRLLSVSLNERERDRENERGRNGSRAKKGLRESAQPF